MSISSNRYNTTVTPKKCKNAELLTWKQHGVVQELCKEKKIKTTNLWLCPEEEDQWKMEESIKSAIKKPKTQLEAPFLRSFNTDLSRKLKTHLKIMLYQHPKWLKDKKKIQL